MTITGIEADVGARKTDERNKRATFENFALFTDCVNKINNTEVDNAKNLDVVMTMYNLITYSHKYAKRSVSL